MNCLESVIIYIASLVWKVRGIEPAIFEEATVTLLCLLKERISESFLYTVHLLSFLAKLNFHL